MQTLDAIKTRRTIRKFTEEPVSHEVIEKIVEASAYAPSWKNTQTARYIIIEETQIHRAAEDRNRPLPPDFLNRK